MKLPTTPADRQAVEDWLASKNSSLVTPKKRLANENNPAASRSCLIILAESLESHTIYAPRVLSQVKGGRSIDAQLMINAGSLPIQDGAYSVKFPDNDYPSLA